jgi:hypothetical protein
MRNDNQTIELKSFNFDKSSDLSTSRAPLVRKEDKRKATNLQIKLDREFRKLNSITNMKKIMYFMYYCLVVDIVVNVYNAYQLIYALTGIATIVSLFYLVEYAISLYNLVLYLKIIINHGEHKKEMNRLRDEKLGLNTKNEKPIIFSEDPFINIDLYLNKTQQGIRNVITFRLLTWIIKYFLYLLIILFQKFFPLFEYYNIFVMLIEYFLIISLSFYFKVILRIEAYKTQYHFEDPY